MIEDETQVMVCCLTFSSQTSIFIMMCNHSESSPRGYDPTASSGRHSRALASGNWRSSETDDDGGGWTTARGSERAERWRSKILNNVLF